MYGAIRHLNRNVDYDSFWAPEYCEVPGCEHNTPNVRVNEGDTDLLTAAPDLADMLAARKPHTNACRAFPATSDEQIWRDCDCGLAALLRLAGRLP